MKGFFEAFRKHINAKKRARWEAYIVLEKTLDTTPFNDLVAAAHAAISAKNTSYCVARKLDKKVLPIYYSINARTKRKREWEAFLQYFNERITRESNGDSVEGEEFLTRISKE